MLGYIENLLDIISKFFKFFILRISCYYLIYLKLL